MQHLVITLICCFMFLFCSTATARERQHFNKDTDILIAQFDSKPDPDDINSQAALGCMLAHKSLAGINYYAVAGAYGRQSDKHAYIPSRRLFSMAFGEENISWTDAHQERQASILRIKNKVAPILQDGGKAWVQEAGQSDLSADWIAALIHSGIDSQAIKENVIVVQHSVWNEKSTTPAKLEYVKKMATYVTIDDGNHNSGQSQDRGDDTPNYKTEDAHYLSAAKKSHNLHAAALWKESERVILETGYRPKYSPTWRGGVDFSDCVENIWIFNVQDADTIEAFFNKYVLQ